LIDFSSERKSRTVQKKIQKTRELKIIVVLRRTEKKRIREKTKTKVLRTGYLIKRWEKDLYTTVSRGKDFNTIDKIYIT
jgi:hypothetical protein